MPRLATAGLAAALMVAGSLTAAHAGQDVPANSIRACNALLTHAQLERFVGAAQTVVEPDGCNPIGPDGFEQRPGLQAYSWSRFVPDTNGKRYEYSFESGAVTRSVAKKQTRTAIFPTPRNTKGRQFKTGARCALIMLAKPKDGWTRPVKCRNNAKVTKVYTVKRTYYSSSQKRVKEWFAAIVVRSHDAVIVTSTEGSKKRAVSMAKAQRGQLLTTLPTGTIVKYTAWMDWVA